MKATPNPAPWIILAATGFGVLMLFALIVGLLSKPKPIITETGGYVHYHLDNYSSDPPVHRGDYGSLTAMLTADYWAAEPPFSDKWRYQKDTAAGFDIEGGHDADGWYLKDPFGEGERTKLNAMTDIATYIEQVDLTGN